MTEEYDALVWNEKKSLVPHSISIIFLETNKSITSKKTKIQILYDTPFELWLKDSGNNHGYVKG